METMKVPSTLLKFASKIASNKFMKRFGCAIPTTINKLETVTFDEVTKVKVDAELTIRNCDIPKVLKELGIM